MKTHLIGRTILDRLERDEAMANCTCMMASENVSIPEDAETSQKSEKVTVEYVEYRDPECPVHYGLLPEEVEGY